VYNFEYQEDLDVERQQSEEIVDTCVWAKANHNEMDYGRQYYRLESERGANAATILVLVFENQFHPCTVHVHARTHKTNKVNAHNAWPDVLKHTDAWSKLNL